MDWLKRLWARLLDRYLPTPLYACLQCAYRRVPLTEIQQHAAETGHAYERIPPHLS